MTDFLFLSTACQKISVVEKEDYAANNENDKFVFLAFRAVSWVCRWL